MKPFTYVKPASLEEAIGYLTRDGGSARLVAGGTDFIMTMKQGINAPDFFIDLKSFPGLNYMRMEEGVLKIGATTLLADLEESALVKEKFPGLAEAAHSVAAVQIRNMGTIGGNLCQEVQCLYYRNRNFACYRKKGEQCFAFDGENKYGAIFVLPGSEKCWSGFPSDCASMLVALDARVKIAGPSGERVLPLEEFYHELGNHLEPGEILTEVQVPAPEPQSTSVYLKFRLGKGVGFAVASAAASLTVEKGVCTRARVVLGAIAPVPWRAREAEEALTGKVVDEQTAEAAAEAALGKPRSLKKNVYKENIARALLKRAVLRAGEGIQR